MLGAALAAGGPAGPGYFGKLPGFADFVTRRLPRGFLDPWDDWLQQSILSARDQLGASWLDTYLTSPIWRFAVSAGVCGPAGWTGLLMPSVDRVGRHFPLTLAAELSAERGLVPVLQEDGWFEELEELALSTLDEPFDAEAFDRQLEALPLPAPGQGLAASPTGSPTDAAGYFPLRSIGVLGRSLPAILEALFPGQLDRYTFWWTSGSTKVAPCLLTCRGLPHTASAAAFLDGNWSRWGWGSQR
jgi:type VI secretion system protein ImpM